jgi:hypothetical protein
MTSPVIVLDRYLDTLEGMGIITISCGYGIFRAALSKKLELFIGQSNG